MKTTIKLNLMMLKELFDRESSNKVDSDKTFKFLSVPTKTDDVMHVKSRLCFNIMLKCNLKKLQVGLSTCNA